MTTLFEVVSQAARRIPSAVVGKATAGTTTTLTDTRRLGQYVDDALIGAWLLIAAGAANGTVEPITDSAQATARVTFATIANAPAAGNAYIVIPAMYDPQTMAAGVNEGLLTIPATEAQDSSLSGDGSTKIFTLPVAVAAGTVRRVEMVQPVADGTLVSEWREWEQRSGGTLAFRQAPWNTWAIRVTYTTSPSVDWADYTATVPSDVPVEFMTWYAIHAAARAVTGRVGYDDSAAQRLADFALEMAERQRPLMAATWPKESVRIWTPTNTPSITLP